MSRARASSRRVRDALVREAAAALLPDAASLRVEERLLDDVERALGDLLGALEEAGERSGG